jgi:hypothetical protein
MAIIPSTRDRPHSFVGIIFAITDPRQPELGGFHQDLRD